MLKKHSRRPLCLLRRLQASAVAGDPAAQTEGTQHPKEMLAALARELPIGEVLPALVDSLEQAPNLVLRAPPGTGKTTVVPLAPLLHGSPWLGPKQRILVLEPRRLAARAAAVRLAANIGERVGDTIGYRTRLERRVGKNARIEVVTTGVLLRRLQRDRALEGVAAVVLDEFHERSVEADLALALCLDCQKRLRPDLRLVVMSATLGDDLAQRLVRIMSRSAIAGTPSENGPGSANKAEGGMSETGEADGSCRMLSCEGRMFPVRTKYLGPLGMDQRHMGLEKAVDAAAAALKDNPTGDVLVFLPGAGEIRRMQQALVGRIAKSVKVLPLYGALPLAQQDAAIRLDPSGARRVVLATAIAESSLTIEGVCAVVDSGMMRVPAQDAASGLTRLSTVPVSIASADQRRGRAGRIGPGTCYRLWSEAAHADLVETSPPEMLVADLAPLALQLASWREDQPDGSVPELQWLDAPPEGGLERAVGLLQSLGAVDREGRITPEGRSMAALGEHPRLARLVLAAQRLGCEALGCMLAALLSEGDVLPRGSTAATADVTSRLRMLLDPAASPPEIQSSLAITLKTMKRLMEGLGAERDADAEITAADGTSFTANTSATGGTPAPHCSATSIQGHSVAETASAEVQTEAQAAEPNEAAQASVSDRQRDEEAATAGPDQAAAAQEAQLRMFQNVLEAQILGTLPGVLIAAAYPERIAQRQSRGNRDRPGFMMANGTSLRLPSAGDPLGREDLLAVAEAGGLRQGGRNDSISLAAPLAPAALEEAAPQLLRSRTRVFWAPGAKAVAGRRQRCIGAIVLEEEPAEVTDEEALPILVEVLRGSGSGPLAALKLPVQAVAFQQRVTWLQTFCAAHLEREVSTAAADDTVVSKGERASTDAAADVSTSASEQDSEPVLERKLQAAAALPDLSDGALAADLGSWVEPHLKGLRSLAQVQNLDWHAIFRSLLDEEQRSLVDELAPEAVQLADGSASAINYSCNPPAISGSHLGEEASLAEGGEHHICGGLVTLHAQQALESPEPASNRRSASKAPKAKKKRGKK